MEDVIKYLGLLKSLRDIPGYLDPVSGKQLEIAIATRAGTGERNFYLKTDLYPGPRDYPQEAVDDVHKALGDSEKGPSNNLHVLTPEQLTATRKVLDTGPKIVLFKKFHFDKEWSKDEGSLSQEKEVLSSIMNDESVKEDLLKTVLDLQLNSKKLVAVTASIRTRICEKKLSRDEGFDQEYREALGKHVTDLKVPQNQDPTFKALFGLDVDENRRAMAFEHFFDLGFY